MNSNKEEKPEEEIDEEILYQANFEDISDEEVGEDEEIASSLSKKSYYKLVNIQTDDFLFDKFVETLQEIVIEDKFTDLKNEFFDKYCDDFEDKEENKLSYMTTFKEYTNIIEQYIVTVKILLFMLFKEYRN